MTPYRMIGALAALVICAPLAASAAELKEVWKASGFDLPESVSYDQNLDVYYVSNLGTDPASKDGNGFISRLKSDGTVDVVKWVTGLDAPKGTEVVGDRLFVTDIDRLVEIDTTTGQIVNSYPAVGAKFLNDLAVAADGRIFMADTANNAIYLFEKGAVSEWVRDPALQGPNGLVIDGTHLVVASVGDISQGFAKAAPSNVKTIDLGSKQIADFGTAAPIGGLDGIELAGDGGVYVTDNGGGRLMKVMPGEAAVEVARLKSGSADFEFVPQRRLVLVPQMGQNEVVALQLG